MIVFITEPDADKDDKDDVFTAKLSLLIVFFPYNLAPSWRFTANSTSIIARQN